MPRPWTDDQERRADEQRPEDKQAEVEAADETAEGQDDLGPLLGAAIRRRVESWRGVEIVMPDQGIRATVVGASQYTVQVSGSTIFVTPASTLPLRSVPAITPDLPLEPEEWGVDFLAADGHKWLCSVEGAGIFYCARARLEALRPALVGWRSVAANLPMVVGHEGAGVVDWVGSAVTDVAVGDHVVIALYGPCGQCANCRSADFVNCNGNERIKNIFGTRRRASFFRSAGFSSAPGRSVKGLSPFRAFF